MALDGEGHRVVGDSVCQFGKGVAGAGGYEQKVSLVLGADGFGTGEIQDRRAAADLRDPGKKVRRFSESGVSRCRSGGEDGEDGKALSFTFLHGG